MYKYKHFIKENIAPAGVKKIVVYDKNNKCVCTIPLGSLTPVSKEKLYSFGVVSDIHVCHWAASWNPVTKFDNALAYFESQGCVMCVVAGDLTQTGFYRRTNESDASTTYFDENQMAKYKEICDKHTIPVHAIGGNHESYYNQDLAKNLDKWELYTGRRDMSYTITQGNDLFILLGQSSHYAVISDADFAWFQEVLAANKNRRCFVFVHSYIEDDSGDAGDFRENSIFDYWGAAKTQAFMDLLKQYPNTILFHGHSHIRFESQDIDKDATFTEKNGFKSVHIPSSGRLRSIDAEDANKDGDYTPYQNSEGQGYIVDVYDDCIVLNGMDLINNKPIPLGVYKIDTPLQTVEANTFTDSTGTIIV